VAEGLERLLEGRRLSPVQRRIARYLVDHLPEAIFMSSVELAVRAGVSQPSVTRFAMGLGFAGYPELRRALRPLVLGGPDARARPDHPLRAGERRLCEAVDEEVRNLRAVRDRLARRRAGAAAGPAAGSGEAAENGAADGGQGEEPSGAGEVTELGRLLAASEPLPVLGLRASQGLATTFAYYAGRIHPDVRLVTHGGAEAAEALHAARRAGAEWLLAVMLPRYPAEAVRALEYAERIGLRIAAITDRPAVPFPAQIVLDAPVGERLVFDSHAAPLVMAMLVVEAMADAAPLRTRSRLDEFERTAEEFGVFHPAPQRPRERPR